MIRLDSLYCSFPSGQGERVPALRGVDLLIPEAQFVTVIGTNGSGKSTLLNCIAGTVRPDSGRVHFDGTDVTVLSDYDRSRWVARIFQNPLSGTAPDLSILENFRLAALRTQAKGFRIGTGKAFREQVAASVEEIGLGLENKLDQPMGGLSGGQRQALTLVMAVMDRSSILLLDEPTAALDPRTAALVMGLADRLIRKHRLTALMVTHNLKDALQCGDRLLHVAEGRVAHDLTGEARAGMKAGELLDWFEA
jgi:putative ABC transport system ATP-binding protein